MKRGVLHHEPRIMTSQTAVLEPISIGSEGRFSIEIRAFLYKFYLIYYIVLEQTL